MVDLWKEWGGEIGGVDRVLAHVCSPLREVSELWGGYGFVLHLFKEF